ncbi:MAG TPA: cobyrinate a,c-diamide synthase [Candidatus Polarisedimenticolia bacterium]|nr:cobyrinate a,c-diamide synthase [Candidatus Polarisedimenticolia bacterium]
MNALVVAGTASGAGKTTVALAIIAALRSRGLTVQPFKCGPDFIDGGHLAVAASRPVRNLDTWMLDAEANREIFSRASASCDVAVVEGMMGLFDGVTGSSEEGSTAEIAKLLGLPVALVLDAGNSARSIAAVVRGFETFDAELRFAGIVLNRVAGDAHFRMLESAIRQSSLVPVLGWLPVEADAAIPERHLGLQTAAEGIGASLSALTRLGSRLDVEQVLSATVYNQEFATAPISTAEPKYKGVRVGVARDRAFSFYYEDNLDLLRENGAVIVDFSPIKDSVLPENLHALYFGGGYPELYAAELSHNGGMLLEIRNFAKANKPIYAECGGLMYLAEKLTVIEGHSYFMAGILPIAIEMTKSLVHFGYADVEFAHDCLLGKKGTHVRGHSFHCSRILAHDSLRYVYRVHYSLSDRREQEGFVRGRVLGTYIHLHFRSNPSLVSFFLRQAGSARTFAEVQ